MSTVFPAISTARRLEADLAPELARYDAARARLSRIPDIARLGPAVDQLSAWTGIPPVQHARQVDDAATARAVVAAAALSDGVRYMDAVAGAIDRHRGAIGHPCDLETLQDANVVCLPAGLDIVHCDGTPVRIRPGTWRRWPHTAVDHAGTRPGAEPDEIPARMRAWVENFARMAPWQARHPLVHAALAAATLFSIAPFPDGNRRTALLAAHGLLRRAGCPVSGVLAAGAEGPHAPWHQAKAARDRDDSLLVCKAFIRATIAVLEHMPARLQELAELADDIAEAMPAFGARFRLSRAELALSLASRPVDTPVGFAERHHLTRDSATRVLRRLVHLGHLELHRINGAQVVVAPASPRTLERLAPATSSSGYAVAEGGGIRPRPAHSCMAQNPPSMSTR